ncbi:MAG TPA: glycosyltransferase family 4 protein [Vicinamibacterales bacterium]|nr:glycosyltransferase family 4 protein [Vicinamibacterales bacterium]
MPTSKQLTFIVPGSIETRTGGYEYDRRIVAALRAGGWAVDVRQAETRGVLQSLRDGQLVVVDGLALGSIGADYDRQSIRLRLIALVHMPGASGTDERGAMCASRSIVVTGEAARVALVADGVDRSRIAIVEPGTESAAVSKGSAGAGRLTLLTVGTISIDKGHENLVNALRVIDEREWQLTIAGSLTRDTGAATRLARAIHDSGLADRISLPGELDGAALSTAYDQADLFVLATLHETYGMAVAEAIARGLPVVSTRTGAIPAIVGDGGIIVAPGNVLELASALSSALRDSALRAVLRDAALRARERLRSWDRAADEFAAVLEQVSGNE